MEGLNGSGKTALAARAPKGQAIFSTDGGWSRAITPAKMEMTPEEFNSAFQIAEYHLSVDLSADRLFAEGEREKSDAAADQQAARVQRETWEPFSRDVKGAFADPSVRSLVWDQADEFNEYARLANFGKLEKNPRLGYGAVNQEYKGLVKLAVKHKKVLILIHQLSQAYKEVTDPVSGKQKSVEDPGRFKRRGNEGVGFLIDSYVRCHYNPPKRNAAGEVVESQSWMVTILSAKKNPEANGLVLESPSWADLMLFLAPDVPSEMWG
jgi:hypothetical protein